MALQKFWRINRKAGHPFLLIYYTVWFPLTFLLSLSLGSEPPPIEPLPPGEIPGIMPAMALKSRNVVRCSFVGTAHYISPEVLKSEDVGPECNVTGQP